MKTFILFATALLFAKPSPAHEFTYDIFLNGPPANASPGTGVGVVTLDLDVITMDLHLNFGGLSTVAASHIHCCTAVALTGTAGVATPFPGFPTGVTSGNLTR